MEVPDTIMLETLPENARGGLNILTGVAWAECVFEACLRQLKISYIKTGERIL